VTASRVEWLRHNRVDLALHHLREAEDSPDPRQRPLLLLHGLGDRSPATVPADVVDWPGPVAALDFTGHGASTVPRGGGYTPELLMADADAALAALAGDEGAITVVGRGLGAYIALQLAGARPQQVLGAVLADGPGLAGGATGPTSYSVISLDTDGTVPDPYALIELNRDLRPRDYVTSFVRLATSGSPLAEPIAVTAIFRPEWLEAVVDAVGVTDVALDEALAAFSRS
jgi:pimeloyl-ACP methyl ester carboxylesterase